MKILLATGGSGGHIFPAISVAERLKSDHHEIIFIGALKKAKEKIIAQGFDIIDLDVIGFSTSSLTKFITSIGFMGKAVIQSYQFLKNCQPDVVVGFGGYGAFAPILSAVALRCPTIIHEQNIIPGKANRWLSRLVDKIAVSFDESKKYFDSEKTVVTGCPSHLKAPERTRAEILKRFNLREGIPIILVLGGSQGSHRINDEFFNAIGPLKKLLDFQVIHATGELDYKEFLKRYSTLNAYFYVSDFLQDIEEAYSVATIVISRAGAVTVSEISLFQVPVIFIPYPYAGGHQKENALILERKGLAKVIDEENLSVEKLMDAILQFLKQPIDPDQENKHLDEIDFSEASQRLAKEIIRLTI